LIDASSSNAFIVINDYIGIIAKFVALVLLALFFPSGTKYGK
jgi:hypothetical protein